MRKQIIFRNINNIRNKLAKMYGTGEYIDKEIKNT